MTRPTPRTYKPEFKQMAVAMVLDQGKTVASTARELDISAYTLHNWVKKARNERGIEPPAAASADDEARKKAREQEKRIAELEREVAFLKSSSVLREGSTVAARYEFIELIRSAPAAEYVFPVTFMCHHLGVSTSGFYEWRTRPESATARRRKELTAQIIDIFELSDATYGYRRIRAGLARNGVEASLELVRLE